MKWARLISSVFIFCGGIVSVRSANESVAGMESCFQAARIADTICSKLPDGPAQRLDCFQRTRSAQLECLEHVLSETPAEPATPKAPSEAPRPQPPASAALPEGSSERVSPPDQTGTLEAPPGIPSAEKSNTRRRRLSERTWGNRQAPRRRRPERFKRASPLDRPTFPHGPSARIG
jgi:hypothetical protein